MSLRWWVLLCLAASSATAQTQTQSETQTFSLTQNPDPAELLGKAPWVGMTAWDAAWCRDLVATAGVVEIREPGAPMRVVWVKDVRGWLKPNGFYGLKLNGIAVDESTVWLLYAGDMVNLRVLFTYGSAPVDGVSEFRDRGEALR
jgi:hypothetical protein